MSEPEEAREELLRRIQQLEARLEETESTLQAIRHGEIDALVVSSPDGPQVYTLQSADHPYRVLVQEMQEGALTLTPTGLILYANLAFARMMRTSLEHIIGTPVQRFVVPRDVPHFGALFARGTRSNSRGEVVLQTADGTLIPVFLACNSFRVDDFQSVCLVVTDLTEQKRQEEILASEALARAILEQTAEALVVIDNTGRIIRASQAAHQLAGRNVLLQDFEAVFPLQSTIATGPSLGVTGNQTLQDSVIRAALRGDMHHGLETTLTRSDGHTFHLMLSLGPLLNARGDVVGGILTFTDITIRKQVEQALQLAHAELEQRVADRTALLALMHDITVAANAAPSPAAALQVALDRICAYTGWPVGHAYLPAPDGTGAWVPTPIWSLADPARFVAFQQVTQTLQLAAGEGLIGRVGATGTPAWGVEVATDPAFRRRHAARQSGLTTGFASPLLVGQEVVGVLEFYAAERLAPDPALLDTLRQIGIELGRTMERQRAHEQMQRQQEALFQREKLAAMGSLLASVAHELNNPLAVILLQADLLRADAGRSPLAEYATDIAEAATRCERLVRQFLTLARQHVPERTAVDLHALLTDTLELLAPAWRVDTITVEQCLAADLPPLWADPHQLQQVLINLLTNAHQALREAAPPRQVRLTTRWDPARTRITLEVADTGPGMPPAIQARIFEPFFTTKPPGVGTGLGLPLCQGIIEGHGGTLSVRSAPGQGTMFRIELLAGVLPASAPDSVGPDEAQPPVSSRAILLVDDEPAIVKALTQLLRRDGHTVDTAANGRLALAQLQERPYDLILSDLRMPELDGPGLYRALEQHASPLCRRFIFLTGDTLSPDVQTFLAQSGVPRLTKPFSAAEVRHAIAQALRAG